MDESDERLELDASVELVAVAALLLFLLELLELFLKEDSLGIVNFGSGIRDFPLPPEDVDGVGWLLSESRTTTDEDFEDLDEELLFPLLPGYPAALIADV